MHETLDPSALAERQVFSCPVCGGKLSRQLPSMKGTLEYGLTFSEDFFIVNSVILAALDFIHARDEDDEDFPLTYPHPVTAVIKMEFDNAGECTEFEILDICARFPVRSLKVNDVKEVKI